MPIPSRSVVFALGLVLALLGFWSVLFGYSRSDDLLLSYPFWWPDTFDWTKQSIVILQKLDTVFADPIFVWRPRDLFWLGIMSLAIGLDAQWILLLALGTCAAVFVVGAYRLGRVLGLLRGDVFFAVLLLILNYSFMLFSLYIMADFIAITAMIWLCILLVNALKNDAAKFGFGSALGVGLLLGFSTCTQIFTLIPGIVFAGTYVVFHARRLSLFRRILPGVVVLGAAGLVRVGVSFVKQSIYGTSLDDRMKYLKFTTESVAFYSEALLIFCAPIIFVALWRLLRSGRNWQRVHFDLVDLFLVGTILSFLLLILSYSTWFEARLLTFFLPFVYLLTFRTLARLFPVEPKSWSSVVEGLVALYLTMTPVNHIMAPHLDFYRAQLLHPLRLVSANAFSMARKYAGEDLQMGKCVTPDAASGESGAGVFSKDIPGCDPYLHYNLRVYWCYKHRVKKCFKDS